MLYDDRKYVKELSKGSREAFESLYLRYSFLVERIFILSRVKGLKNREIAEELGVSIKTVEYQSSFCF